MRGIESHRERIIGRLGDAYAERMLDTSSLEMRVDAALRAGAPEALRAAVWDLPHPADALRLLVMRARWLVDLAFGVDHPFDHVVPVDLARLAATVERGRWTIGRSQACDILVRPSRYVSGHHAELSLRDGRWRLRDLGSTNGTWIGGRRVGSLLVDRRVPVVLGDVQLRFD